MLSCIVGKMSVGSFESPDKLKGYSDKGILKCPTCGEELIFCNGNYKSPYFRHKQLNEKCKYEDYICGGKYNKVTKEEHSNGIKTIYEQLIKIENIKNIQLEKQIKETNQRADIYFECNNQSYVVEFQCSPIQKEYSFRHELYCLNNIKDIWILGNSKFDTREVNKEIKFKVVEKELLLQQGFILYLNNKNNKLDCITNKDYSLVERDNGRYGTKTLISTFKLNNINEIEIVDIINNIFNDIDYNNGYYYNLLNLSLLGETFLIDTTKKIFRGKKSRKTINIEEDNVEDEINNIKNTELSIINKLRDRRFLCCKDILSKYNINLKYTREPFDNNLQIECDKPYVSKYIKIDVPSFYDDLINVGKEIINIVTQKLEKEEFDKKIRNILESKIEHEQFYHYYDFTLTNYINNKSVKLNKDNYEQEIDKFIQWYQDNNIKAQLFNLKSFLYSHYRKVKNISILSSDINGRLPYRVYLRSSCFKKEIKIQFNYENTTVDFLVGDSKVYTLPICDIEKDFKNIINIIVPNIFHNKI